MYAHLSIHLVGIYKLVAETMHTELFTNAPVFDLLHKIFEKSSRQDVLDWIHTNAYGVVNWVCYSDYYLNKEKANNVLTFSFLPVVGSIQLYENLIRRLVPTEIKHARTVNPLFLSFLARGPFLNFSFILTNYKYLFFKTHRELTDFLIRELQRMIDIIPTWIEHSQRNKNDYIHYQRDLVKIQRQIRDGHKIQLFRDMLLVASIGGYLSAAIADITHAEKMAWLSDRDAINDLGKLLSTRVFHSIFTACTSNQSCEFFVAPARCKDKEWYHQFIKIPDYITGALADFDMDENVISHEKFATLLRNVIADNNHNILVYKMDFSSPPSCSRIIYTKNDCNF